MAKSKGEARRLIEQGGAYMNGARVGSSDVKITENDFQNGALLLQAGKKRHRRIVFS